MYRILFTSKAKKDLQLLKESGLASKAKEILEAMQKDPYTPHPPYEKLVGASPECGRITNIFGQNKRKTTA